MGRCFKSYEKRPSMNLQTKFEEVTVSVLLEFCSRVLELEDFVSTLEPVVNKMRALVRIVSDLRTVVNPVPRSMLAPTKKAQVTFHKQNTTWATQDSWRTVVWPVAMAFAHGTHQVPRPAFARYDFWTAARISKCWHTIV